MKDTESYVNKAELKRKVRAWLKYRQSSKQVTDELLDSIEKLPVMVKGQLETTLESEWISVRDRLPEQYTDVIVLYDFGSVGINWTNKENEFVEYADRIVTHWMHLPTPPKGG